MAYGTINADQIGTSVANTSLGAGNASIMKNRIINGAMVVSQRNGTSTVTPTDGQYLLDRYVTWTSQSSKFTVAQSSTAPAGFSNSLLVTSSSAYSVTSGDYFGIAQYIEGFNTADLAWGTASAKTVTLSFQVYSSLTGTFGGALQNSAFNRSYPFTYTISSANTWTTVSITIAGDTSGTWIGATNGVGMRVMFSLGMGSTYSGTAGAWAGANYLTATGATSVVGTNGATFYITGVQLEVGSSATGFEYVNYQTSLANCQRYFVSFGGSSSAEGLGVGALYSTTQALIVVALPVEMRTSPTLGYSGAGDFSLNDGSAQSNTSALSIDNAGTKSGAISATASGMTLGRAARFRCASTSSRLTYSAEL